MAEKNKYDGVITAVRYSSEGAVDWVRAFERRGPTFSDRLKLHRDELVEAIKSGKKLYIFFCNFCHSIYSLN